MVSEEEGKFLVKLAKESIKNYIVRRKIIDVPEDVPDTLKEDMGAFVTLNKDGMLRGCIGYSEPIKPLVNAVIDVAISAAVNDPRFPPVSLDELDDLEIEVSVLTKPEIIEVEKPEEYLDKIEIGMFSRLGLIQKMKSPASRLIFPSSNILKSETAVITVFPIPES